jgi:hypothetical protein
MKHTQIESILLGILLVTFILGLYWGFTRPLLRAILEINGLAGSQFSPPWVEVFNHTLHLQPELAHR